MFVRYLNLFSIITLVSFISCSLTKEISQKKVPTSKGVFYIWDSTFENIMIRDTVAWCYDPAVDEPATLPVIKQLHPESIKFEPKLPNPFSPPSNIYFRVSKADTISIKIITSDSLMISTRIDMPKGNFRLGMIDLRGKSGSYFFNVSSRDTLIKKRMLFLW